MALKPICSGGRSDARLLHAAAGKVLPLDGVNPWHFRAALAPVLAARKEKKRVRLRQVVTHIRRVAKGFEVVIIEGAGGLLLFATNVAPGQEEEFNRWYNEEHIPLLTAIDGCLAARRYHMPGGKHRYLAMYHLASPDVQATPAWKQAVQTEWTKKMLPHLSDSLRLVLRPYVRGAD